MSDKQLRELERAWQCDPWAREALWNYCNRIKLIRCDLGLHKFFPLHPDQPKDFESITFYEPQNMVRTCLKCNNQIPVFGPLTQRFIIIDNLRPPPDLDNLRLRDPWRDNVRVEYWEDGASRFITLRASCWAPLHGKWTEWRRSLSLSYREIHSSSRTEAVEISLDHLSRQLDGDSEIWTELHDAIPDSPQRNEQYE